ncbi:serine/threonine-protein kinase [Nonomuraea typhae]|uniref:non-specific serine/threonine protein kinase n=1 Tax=Nonomuraea typhae TaxID=2603600 RepID=A0ABW7YWG0_9ACTN
MEWSAPGYTEVRQLGAGGSGRVVLAVHDDTGVKVAIKYLNEQLRRDPAALARFQSEARLLTTVRDQHIATMWEYIQEPDGAAIVMELVNGVSLRALLRENGTTGPEAALVVLKGSLLGLARAHTLGLVHRDYKPENVLVREDGVSKLVDFGIAVREGTAAHPEGTPPYMAPEMWAGGPASAATDVYAATAVFFECLTGHRPYRSTEPSVLGYQHLHAPIPVQDAPEPVRELITRGMAKEPERRPAGAAEFVTELEAVARAAYGEDWEERGRRRLAALVGLLALLWPLPQAATPQVGTAVTRTVFRAMRANAVRMSVGAGLAVAVAVAAVVALNNRVPVTPVDTVAAAPSETPELNPAQLGTPTPTLPTETPEVVDPSAIASVPVAVVPSVSAPPTDPATGPVTDPSTDPQVTNPALTNPPATKSPPTKTSAKPTTKSTTKKPAKPTTKPPTEPSTKPATPTPTITPVPPTGVSALSLGRLTLSEDNVASGSIAVRATGTAEVTLTARLTVGGTTVRSTQARLRGALSYTRSFSHTLPERPCGENVTLTVTTSPAAPDGARSSTVAVPACPTEVTSLRAALAVAQAPGRAVSVRVVVGASGTAAIPMSARLSLNGEQVLSRQATLSGQRSYIRAFSHAFAKRPCGGTLSVHVTAGSRQTSAQATVPCPAGVARIAILRAVLSTGGKAVATVGVTTLNEQAVRLSVAFTVAGRTIGSRVLELAGKTAYAETVAFAARKVSCGVGWSVTASAGGKSDSASGRTPACPPEPSESPSQPPTDKKPSENPTETPKPEE